MSDHSSSNRATLTISILERVLSDEISANEALTEWPSIEEESVDLIAKAWHELTHYAADERCCRNRRWLRW